MFYPVAIEPGDDNMAFGVLVPDLPGCFSAGDTLDEALKSATEAIAFWIEAALGADEALPQPSSLEAVRSNRDLDGWIFERVSSDPRRHGA